MAFRDCEILSEYGNDTPASTCVIRIRDARSTKSAVSNTRDIIWISKATRDSSDPRGGRVHDEIAQSCISICRSSAAAAASTIHIVWIPGTNRPATPTTAVSSPTITAKPISFIPPNEREIGAAVLPRGHSGPPGSTRRVCPTPSATADLPIPNPITTFTPGNISTGSTTVAKLGITGRSAGSTTATRRQEDYGAKARIVDIGRLSSGTMREIIPPSEQLERLPRRYIQLGEHEPSSSSITGSGNIRKSRNGEIRIPPVAPRLQLHLRTAARDDDIKSRVHPVVVGNPRNAIFGEGTCTSFRRTRRKQAKSGRYAPRYENAEAKNV